MIYFNLFILLKNKNKQDDRECKSSMNQTNLHLKCSSVTNHYPHYPHYPIKQQQEKPYPQSNEPQHHSSLVKIHIILFLY